jgi:hypothetical protein
MSALGSKLRLCEGGLVQFRCPGCGENHGVYVKPAEDGSPRPVWGFNGDGDRPTFNPSVLCRFFRYAFKPGTPEFEEDLRRAKEAKTKLSGKDMVCHSFVRDGQIEFLADCTHELAGRTVALPDWEG